MLLTSIMIATHSYQQQTRQLEAALMCALG